MTSTSTRAGTSRRGRWPRVAATAIMVAAGASPPAGASTKGVFTEYAVAPGSGPTQITVGPDGRLWFTELSAAKVGAIDAGGNLQEYAIGDATAEPGEITAGPDGNLWFSDYTNHRIYRLTTAGAFTAFDIPTPGAEPGGVAVGPDGAIWFTETETDRLGRVNADGEITEFLTGTNDGGPYDLVAGPDGAIWFTLETGNAIGRMSVSGQVTTFPLETINAAPQGITVGPDGALWFAENVANRIGRITVAGELSEYVLTGDSRPRDVALGPDGRVWFVEQLSGRLGAIGPDGVIETFPGGGANSFPFGLTTGPDNASVWFTYRDRVGAFHLAPRISNVTPSCAHFRGGSRVRIDGTLLGGVDEVRFGSVPATFRVVSGTLIEAVAPSQPPGIVDVVAVSEGGESGATTGAQLVYSRAADVACSRVAR